jgi:FkbM family methyltransferase
MAGAGCLPGASGPLIIQMVSGLSSPRRLLAVLGVVVGCALLRALLSWMRPAVAGGGICPFVGLCGRDCIGTAYGGKVLPPSVAQYMAQRENLTVFSFGVGMDVSFDVALACLYGHTVNLFDPSPVAVEHIQYLTQRVGTWPAAAGAASRLPRDSLEVAGPGGAAAAAAYWAAVRQSRVGQNALRFRAVALAEHDGKITFRHSRGQTRGASFSADPLMRSGGAETDTLTVPARSFATLLREAGRRSLDVVKIDVEGLETELLLQLLQLPLSELPAVVFVDMDSICCCSGDGCEEKAKAGWAAVHAMQGAGYTSIGTDDDWVSDVTFYLPRKVNMDWPRHMSD